MNTQEIRSEDWREFCEKFTQASRGSLLTLEQIDSDGIRSDIGRDLPLDKMTLDTTDACNDVISIALGSGPDQRKMNHFMVDPVYLRIRTEGGRKVLQIGAEGGVTLVTFHSGAFPQLTFSEDRRYAIPS